MKPHTHSHDDAHDDYHDLGLPADLNMWLKRPLERRRVLQLGALGIGTLLAGCSSAQAITACLSEIPEETAGPYPADGSSGMGGGPGGPGGGSSDEAVNVLERSGIVRSDIKTSLNTGNTAAGVPATITLLLQRVSDCTPLAGYAIYLWHCTRDGAYSMYGSGIESEDYLRGVQETDSEGRVTFGSIFPACYAGRWPHVHFEVYPNLATATNADNKLHTSQLALPEDVCLKVFETAEGYSGSLSNMAQVSLESDNVFSDDGAVSQLATVSGSVTEGYTIELTFGLDV